jgi:hypothetical protein
MTTDDPHTQPSFPPDRGARCRKFTEW